ncbi:aminodeoxychorismate synthase component I [Solirhodobacter olei]|uniref:aminodeoxychorismate synthase component I n=1 Tax=Solirhodobacter olei TaxID=2493082 RepID=UPI000FDAFF71
MPAAAGTRPGVLFDQGPLSGGTLFCEPCEIIRAETPGEVRTAFDAIERLRRQGKWLAGYASYELGYLITDRLTPLLPTRRQEPLLLFGAFDGPSALTTPPHEAVQGPVLSNFTPDWDFTRYREAFDRVHAYISAGDIYQANLTFPLTARVSGTPYELYRRLCAVQPVPHGAFVDLGGPVLLSRSPELFFRIDALGRAETLPMKGTLPRYGDPVEDADRRERLAKDPKNRAENLMIVDLLRNDLSRVAEVGSVRVPALFRVETFATVHQMTSRVVAKLRDGWCFQALCEALFPCGSVTGAPKIRAMEIIRELEPCPRGAYCGAIGWISPSGAMEFSVAIRTLVLPGDGTARLNVGGGIVHDSTAETEYEEALWKTRFATSLSTT